MSKVVVANEALNNVKDGMSIMVGGFMTVGTPEHLIDELVKLGVKDLTIICNDAGFEEKGVGKLIKNNQVTKLITSHIGLNPYAGKLMSEGRLECILTPQGTLVEQIRSGGSGLGGVLTATGLGTIVAEGKEIIEIDGKEFLLEKPLKADVALIGASSCDEKGNSLFNYTTRNFNPIMATAANTVIVGTNKVVSVGEIHPDHVITPHVFVDYIVMEEK